MPANLTIRAIEDGDIASVLELWEKAAVTRPWNDARHDIAFARRQPHSTILLALDSGIVTATAMVGEDGDAGFA